MSASFSARDREHMADALALAARGLYTTDPNPRVGCVLVAGERVIGRGYHRRAGLPHAEIEALHACSEDPRGATAYVTLEPCSHHGQTPPCCDALIDAGIARAVIGGSDPNAQVAGAGIARMQAAGIRVDSGLMQAECEALNPGFLSRMRRRRPWVRLKLAASLDGRTALANGESKWITSAEARLDVQRLRARASVILTGSGTVLADNPRMTLRLSDAQYGDELPQRQPLLAIVDSQARTPRDAVLFDRQGGVLIYTGNVKNDWGTRCEVVDNLAQTPGGRVDLPALLGDLAARGCNECHVEAGAGLAAALISEQLVDELVVYIAPLLLGRDALELVSLGGIDNMADRPEFDYTDITSVGRDLRLTLTPHSSAR
jgi:diaminohydroxyphosphoribosylaminopyrimidine deaminase/5-amino-6-(5-phosphoribosylamino)uracil reductase